MAMHCGLAAQETPFAQCRLLNVYAGLDARKIKPLEEWNSDCYIKTAHRSLAKELSHVSSTQKRTVTCILTPVCLLISISSLPMFLTLPVAFVYYLLGGSYQ